MEWRKSISYPDLFIISEFGDVLSKRTGKVLRQGSSNGYWVISTRVGGREGKCLLLRVHRLVAECFLPEPSQDLKEWAKDTKYGKVLVNHIDEDKGNNHFTNLEWCDGSTNSKHSIHNRTTLRGVDTTNSKLSCLDVLTIRREYKPKSRVSGARALARRFNVSHRQVLRIINGESYKDLL